MCIPWCWKRPPLKKSPDSRHAIRLSLALQGIQLSDWQPDKLRIYLAGNAKQAADIYMLLCRHVRQIVLTPRIGRSVPFAAGAPASRGVRRRGGAHQSIRRNLFRATASSRSTLSCRKSSCSSTWKDGTTGAKGGRAGVSKYASSSSNPPFPPPRVRKESFALAATPAINLFPHDANPIRLDHLKSEYLVRPSGGNNRNYQVYNITEVTGFVQGTARERTYEPFEMFSPNPDATPTYHVHVRQSPVRHGSDFYLSVAYPPGTGSPPPETLSIQLQCTNGQLPEGLQVGDIRYPTSNTPEFVDFPTCGRPRPSILPLPGHNLHWKLLSHLCLNYRSLADAKNLQALLGLYNFEENRDRPAFWPIRKESPAYRAFTRHGADRLVQRVIMRGREIELDLRQDHFAGPGDLFLFGSVLDHFFSLYASMNTYTRLSVKEVLKGEVYQWPARIGDHPLI
jgi:type VI secretion system protein ImpG